jgi:hypothetical protein
MLMSVSGLVSTLASIIQQCHTIVWWSDIKIGQQAYALANPGRPEMVVAGPSYGLDLVMFYLRESGRGGGDGVVETAASRYLFLDSG